MIRYEVDSVDYGVMIWDRIISLYREFLGRMDGWRGGNVEEGYLGYLAIHNMKANAGLIGRDDLVRICHKLEGKLGSFGVVLHNGYREEYWGELRDLINYLGLRICMECKIEGMCSECRLPGIRELRKTS